MAALLTLTLSLTQVTEGVASELGALAALARRRGHVRAPLDARLDAQLGEPARLPLAPAARRAARLQGARARRLSTLACGLAAWRVSPAWGLGPGARAWG